jgi:hypothetical protein
MSLWDDDEERGEEGLGQTLLPQDEDDPGDEGPSWMDSGDGTEPSDLPPEGSDDKGGAGHEGTPALLECDPVNPQLPHNPAQGVGFVAALTVVAGYAAFFLALVFAGLGASLADAEGLFCDDHAGCSPWVWAAASAFVISCLVLVAAFCLQAKAFPVLVDLVFERLRSPWLGVFSLTGLLLFVLFFVSGLLPVQLGSGSLCQETFFAEPKIDGDAINFRASGAMCTLLLLFYARFALVSLCNSEWHTWHRAGVGVYLLGLLSCGATTTRLYMDLQYCTLAFEDSPPACGVILKHNGSTDATVYDWVLLGDADTSCGTACNPRIGSWDRNSSSSGSAAVERAGRETGAMRGPCRRFPYPSYGPEIPPPRSRVMNRRHALCRQGATAAAAVSQGRLHDVVPGNAERAMRVRRRDFVR